MAEELYFAGCIREVTLPDGTLIRAWSEPVGLCNPAESNEVIVAAKIALPASKNNFGNFYLVDHLRFGATLTLLNEGLTMDWGRALEPDWRIGAVAISGATWRKAFAGADALLKAEIAKLTKAIEARQAALNSDGVEIVRQWEAYVAAEKTLSQC